MSSSKVVMLHTVLVMFCAANGSRCFAQLTLPNPSDKKPNTERGSEGVDPLRNLQVPKNQRFRTAKRIQEKGLWPGMDAQAAKAILAQITNAEASGSNSRKGAGRVGCEEKKLTLDDFSEDFRLLIQARAGDESLIRDQGRQLRIDPLLTFGTADGLGKSLAFTTFGEKINAYARYDEVLTCRPVSYFGGTGATFRAFFRDGRLWVIYVTDVAPGAQINNYVDALNDSYDASINIKGFSLGGVTMVSQIAAQGSAGFEFLVESDDQFLVVNGVARSNPTANFTMSFFLGLKTGEGDGSALRRTQERLEQLKALRLKITQDSSAKARTDR